LSRAITDGSGFGRWALAASIEDFNHVGVGELRKIPVLAADRIEELRRFEAYEIVRQTAEFRTVSAGATGVATTTRLAPSRRIASTAASMEAPVARPSSTRMTVRPFAAVGARLR
jgi:hypothetical protein